MRDTFITGHNITDYMKEAINIYVASNYLSRPVIDDIKANLNQLPFKGGKNFKFILNQDFHEDPGMRKVLINMLLELPNTEVRIYKGERRFHAKLYIFESGNQVYTAIGSFNATLGGAGQNIEAGVQLKSREIYKDAKAFFEKYWDSEYSEVAKYDESACFVKKKFKPGDSVVVINDGQHAVILIDPPELIDKEWQYIVFINGNRRKVAESNLKHLEVATFWNENEYQLTSSKDVVLKDWLKNYILEKSFELTDRTLSSFASSRTEIYPYQFRPLFKILQSIYHRILIADEVGLGKTIEAGIILKEFLNRTDMQRVLIIVPNSLKTKWKDELMVRFDEYFDVLSASNIIDFLNDYLKSSGGSTIKGIISYDQLVVKSLREKLNKLSDIPVFDMVIIDEAHHLKNDSTLRYKTIETLTSNANALIMLTATPLQLATKDLYNILNLLLPDTYVGFDNKAFSAKLTVNERINEAIKSLKKREFDLFKDILNEIKSKRGLRKHIEHFNNYEEIMNKCDALDQNTEEKEINNVALELYSLNVLNQYITRTLRKDVQMKFPDRVPLTYEYEYSPEEKALYDDILASCRRKYSAKKSAFSLIMPERCAASSLIAMAKNIKNVNWGALLSEYQDTFVEVLEEKEGPELDLKSQKIDDDVISSFDKHVSLKIDSKLNRLKSIIDFVFYDSKDISDKKVMIFCNFIHTISYLKDKLHDMYCSAHVESMSGIDEMSARDEKRKLFAANDKPKILICSDVAGEGLDFQFCHYLVNYDMPWNPSKLEQRVGRIDRIGQKSEKVTIINLVNKYTIEDHIMARLFERVKLFNSTIGPLGEILSRYEKDFNVNMLKAERTAEEKEEYERKILENIDRIKKEQELFEEKQVELFGILDYFYDELRAKCSYFNEHEIKIIWDCYLHEYKNINDIKFELRSEKNIIFLKVDSKMSKMLRDAIKNGLSGSFENRKRKHYSTLVNLLEEERKELKYTFNHKCALENLDVQFLNITHPFIKGALRFLKQTYQQNKLILSGRIKSNILKFGQYIVFIYRFNVLNVVSANREYVEEHFFIYDKINNSGYWESGSNLLQELLCQNYEYHATDLDLSSTLDDIKNFINERKSIKADSILTEYIKINSTNINRKKQILSNHYQREIDLIKERLKYIHDQHSRNNFLDQVRDLEDQKQSKMAELITNDLRIVVRCSGIIALEVK